MMTDPVKILVVDDEPDLASLIRQKFRKQIRAGLYDFSMAGDGVEALEVLEGDPDIHIVLTDINMPRMDGLTLLAHLGELERLLQAVVVSAYGDMVNIRTAMNRGSFDFLTKPIDLDDLEITINKARETVKQQMRAMLAREAFGRYVSDEVVSLLLASPEALRLGGEKRRLTIVMSDLRGFSTVTERLPPERVVEILNIYLGKMAEVITAYQGTIDEFIGDAILIMFGAPIHRDDDARRAVACACAMQCAMEAVNVELTRLGLPVLEMGIGINTGEVVVGNIGSYQRAKYGVVGSHVNLTARIESYTVGGQILISENTLHEAGPDIGIGKRMQVTTKGFSEPISIYEVEYIGAPYHLALPKRVERLTPLEVPLAFRYTVLDGKHVSGNAGEGRFLALSGVAAHVQVEPAAELLSNLKIMLLAAGDAEDVVGDLYAKVVAVDETAGTARLRFTAVPEDIAEALRQYASSDTDAGTDVDAGQEGARGVA